MKDKHGKHVPLAKRADNAADFLGTVFWGGATDDNNQTNPQHATEHIVTEDTGITEHDITMPELVWAIKKL